MRVGRVVYVEFNEYIKLSSTELSETSLIPDGYRPSYIHWCAGICTFTSITFKVVINTKGSLYIRLASSAVDSSTREGQFVCTYLTNDDYPS